MYVQSNTLLLADVFENFRNMCLKIYELDPTQFFTASGLAWQGALKKSKVKLDLLTFFKKKIGIHSVQGWRANTKHGVTRKRNTKRLRLTDCLEKTCR